MKLAHIDFQPSADTPPGALSVLFCGGFHSSMQGTKACLVETVCRRQQIACRRFDYRGHGDSPGKAVDFNLRHWLEDTLSMLDSLPSPTIVVGSSMGAWLACLAAARRQERVAGLLLLAAAPDFTHELLLPALSAADRQALRAGQSIRLQHPYEGEAWVLREHLFSSGQTLALFDPENTALADIQCPVHLIHGTADNDIPWSFSTRLLNALPHPNASLELICNADHRLGDPSSLQAIEHQLLALLACCQPCFSSSHSQRS